MLFTTDLAPFRSFFSPPLSIAVVESSGISEPLPVAETFTFEDNGTSLSQVGNTGALARTYNAWARDGAWAGRGKRW